jgi:hypothetical protein
VKDDWTDDEGRSADEWTGTNRTIREMKLREVSPCTFPAYETTDIAARSSVLEAREARLDLPPAKRGKSAKNGSASRTGERASTAPAKPYGDVTYADPGYQKDGKARYPLDNKKHARAAWAYINVAANQTPYNSEQLASIKAKIKTALTKYGVDVSAQNEAELADTWREKIEARKAAEKAKRAAKKEKRSQDSACPGCGITLTVICPHVGGANKSHSFALPKPGDPNVYGANHGVSGTVVSDTVTAQQNDADTSGEARDAKATYADIETCGECGATSQYGAYCGACGEPMRTPKTQGDFCTSCGAKLDDGNRDAHVCETRDKNKSNDLANGTAHRVPQIVTALGQALKIFGAADVSSLPKDVQQAIVLVTSAMVHATHVQSHEGLAPSDALPDSATKGRSDDPKPDDSTSGSIPDDKALILMRMHMISRDVELGL